MMFLGIAKCVATSVLYDCTWYTKSWPGIINFFAIVTKGNLRFVVIPNSFCIVQLSCLYHQNCVTAEGLLPLM